jgi:superfamily II DNA or RNA helicase
MMINKIEKYSPPVQISTWQALQRQPKAFFEQYDAVFVDEAHTASATTIKKIMEKSINAQYRVGLTGTIEDSKTHELTLTGLFGEKYDAISTRELMDKGLASPLKIKTIVLNHSPEACKLVSKMTYVNEIKVITGDPIRNNLILNLAGTQKNNTLILFNHIAHGKHLFEEAKNRFKDKEIFYISGETDPQIREAIREKVERLPNAIIIASYGVFSTGINIRNLHHIIFAHPFKSKIKNLQAIGRVLRLYKDKDTATLYDIADNYTWKSKENITYKHYASRLEIYIKQEFEYTITLLEVNDESG